MIFSWISIIHFNTDSLERKRDRTKDCVPCLVHTRDVRFLKYDSAASSFYFVFFFFFFFISKVGRVLLSDSLNSIRMLLLCTALHVHVTERERPGNTRAAAAKAFAECHYRAHSSSTPPSPLFSLISFWIERFISIVSLFFSLFLLQAQYRTILHRYVHIWNLKEIIKGGKIK